ncbi:MAG TPA: hypothetical protein VF572_02870 [Candidatus Saccharimonadales bacterium]
MYRSNEKGTIIMELNRLGIPLFAVEALTPAQANSLTGTEAERHAVIAQEHQRRIEAVRNNIFSVSDSLPPLSAVLLCKEIPPTMLAMVLDDLDMQKQYPTAA